jgi:hypothetical protein
VTVVQGEPVKAVEPMKAPKHPGPEHDHCDLTFDGSPRCTARSKQAGRRCARAATPGTNVCANHGSKSPQVQRRARMRLAELVDPSITRLARIMASGEDKDALRAIENILDRAGYPRKMEIDNEVAKALLVERLLQMQSDTIDGEVISDAEEA